MRENEKDTLMDVARRFLEDAYTQDGAFTLRWWRDEFLSWNGTKYGAISASELRALVLEWLDANTVRATPRKAADVTKCLESLCRIPSDVELPAYLAEPRYGTRDWITMQDGIVDLGALLDGKKDVQRPHTPEWFCTTALPYSFKPDATCPKWLAFLTDVFDGDDERIALLQEWFGYCLTDDTNHQAIMLLQGPPRSGKGTTLRTLRKVVGEHNCVDPRLSHLGDRFGLESLIGKTIAVFPDAHLGRGDKAMSILETLKSISGEDAIEVSRKFRPSVSCRLNVRFILSVNELPKFGDNSTGLSDRLHVLLYKNSYLGHEDRDLEEKLIREVPGISMWAVAGLKRLRELGYFTRPSSGEAVIQEFARLSSPVHAFIEDHCVVQADAQVKTSDLYDAYKKWCDDDGHQAVSNQRLGVQLRSLIPRLAQTQPRRPDGTRHRFYIGIGLNGTGGTSGTD